MKKTIKALVAFQMLISSLALAQSNEVIYRPWLMHRGEGPIPVAGKVDLQGKHGNPVAYQLANIPALDKADGWVEAPMKDGLVTFIEASKLPCYQQVDFTYFKTTVFIPANLPADKKVKSLSVTVGSVDDGARMIIYNNNNIIGYFNPSKDGRLMGKNFTIDFSDRLADGHNTILIIQMDDCATGNIMSGGLTVKINGNVLPPTTKENWCQKFPNYCIASPPTSENPGDVKIEGDELVLTQDLSTQKGATWSKTKVDLARDFEISAELNFGSKDAPGADGMALVFQNKSTHELSEGGGIGYQGINPSFALEFDTWQNAEKKDPSKDHIGKQINGNTTHSGTDYKEVDNLEDSKYHPIVFKWFAKTKTFSLTLDGKAIFTNEPSNSNLSGSVYWGFTASTGGSSNKQSIKKISSKQ